MRKGRSWWNSGDSGASLRQPVSSSSSSPSSLEEAYPSLAERVFLLYNSPTGEAEFDIVLLHGLGSGEFKCWTNEHGLLWPAAFLPQEFPQCRILSAGYAHVLWRWSSSEKMKVKDVEEMVQREGDWAAGSIRRWVTEVLQGTYPSFGAGARDDNQREENEEPQGSLAGDTVPPRTDSSLLSESEQQRLESCAADLAERLLSDTVGVGRRPVIFIVHSLGGLVIKQMIVQLHKAVSLRIAEKETKIDEEEEKEQQSQGSEFIEESFLRSLRGVVFYATPHFGAPIASIVTGLKRYYQRIGGMVPSPLVITLGDHNREQLQSLNEQFFQVIEGCSDTGYVHVLSFGETRRLNGVLRVVEPASANPAPDDPRFPFYLLDTDHVGINRPVSKEQPGYTILFGFLKRMQRSGSLSPKERNKVAAAVLGEKPVWQEGETCDKAVEAAAATAAVGVFKPSVSDVAISHLSSKEFHEVHMLLTLLDHLLLRLRTLSTTLFGYMIPVQLTKLLTLAKDIVDYTTTSFSLKTKPNDACLLIPLQLVVYWAERAVSTLENFFVCQAERSVIKHFSAVESRTLHDIDCGVAVLRSEWERFHLQLCQTRSFPDSYPVIIFFSQSVTLAVADTMMDYFGCLLVLAIKCMPEACGWQQDAAIWWGSQENTDWLPPSVSMVGSLLTGWMYLGVTRRYSRAITAFRRLLRDLYVLQRDKNNLLHTTTIPDSVGSITQESNLSWWWNNVGSGSKAKTMSTEQKNNLLQVFFLLAHAGLCWSYFLLAQRTGVVASSLLTNTATYEGAFHQSLMEGNRYYNSLERDLHIDDSMDRPFAAIKRVPVVSSTVQGKPHHDNATAEERQKRSLTRASALLKRAALRRNFFFTWHDVRQGETLEEAANRFFASVLVFWWIIERRAKLHRSVDAVNKGKDVKEAQDKGPLHGRSSWVWEKAHPHVKSQWLTWWCFTNEVAKKSGGETNTEQFQILTEALQFHNSNALALYLTGRHHLWRRQLAQAADAYLRVLESTRCVDNALYRVSAVGLGWVHLHYHHCGGLEGSGVDFLAMRGAPSGLRESWWLEQWWEKQRMHELRHCNAMVTATNMEENNNEEKRDIAHHLKRASALFESVLAFDPCNKGALCGMGRVKMLALEAACTVSFPASRSHFAAVLGKPETTPETKTERKWGNWENDIVAIDNGLWESRAAYWMGEIHRCGSETDFEAGGTQANVKKDVKALWEYAVKRCPQNDWALTSLGLLHLEHEHQHHHHHPNDVETIRQCETGIEMLRRSMAINARNTWTLWGLVHHSPDVTQRQTCGMLLKKLLRK